MRTVGLVAAMAVGTVMGSVVVGSLGIAVVAVGGAVTYVAMASSPELAQERGEVAVAARKAKPRHTHGEIQVSSMAAVTLYLDGAMVPYDANVGYLSRVSPGSHQLVVRNAFGKEITSRRVQVKAGERMLLNYGNKTLSPKGSVAMALPRPAPAPVAAPAPQVVYVAAAPPVGMPAPTVYAAPAPSNPWGLWGSVENTERTRSTESSERSGSVTTQGPGG